ncbi:MAG TPA: pyridoxal phosphate-dependent aminotransferase [Myxococcota bacterium]|nr:pyridoxal phosphate-dependent aminotransferase [Myxococcota bacterium]
MPRPPAVTPSVAAMPGAIYSPRAVREADLEPRACPLNVGDTWFEPFEGGRMEDLHGAEYPELNRYTATRGLAPLIDAIVEKVRARNELACERESVLVTAGATAGLGCAVGMLASPDEEILILAPFWPLIRGIAQTFRARPVEVPFYDRVDSAAAAVEAVRERLSPKSVALYVSSPSNPTGRVLPESWLAALAELACRENLWLLSDEVYEDYVYEGRHVSLARFAPERTLSAFSFSKAYGMAGNRTGYLVGPPAAIAQAEKIATHSFYSAPTAGQIAGLRALQRGQAWVDRARASYRAAGIDAAAALGLPAPQGSTFLFVDARPALDERGIEGLLADCLEDGVAVAPGGSCGRDYASWLRLCYTSAPPAEVGLAVSKLAKRLAAR